MKATTLTGEAKGDNVLIPRIPVIPNNLPFNFKHLQFPLKVAFSMTDYQQIAGSNLKASRHKFGHTLFFPWPALHSLLTRSKSQNLHVYAERKKSLNIVYRSILE